LWRDKGLDKVRINNQISRMHDAFGGHNM